jgi:beta-glucosidase
VRLHDWVVDSGSFDIFVGGSSQGPLLSETVKLQVERRYPALSRESMLKDFGEHPSTRASYRPLLDGLIALFSGTSDAAALTPEKRKARDMAEAFLSELPVWKLPLMSQGKFTEQQLQELLGQAG